MDWSSRLLELMSFKQLRREMNDKQCIKIEDKMRDAKYDGRYL